MSNKSGIEHVISLPSGGGSIHGLGERFGADLFTGTGNFSIPIALPNGRNGVQPELTLAYSTGSGNGPFGLGWSLPTAGIMRNTSKGVPTYDSPLRRSKQDVFTLSGVEDLVPIAETMERTEYRPRTEGLFAKIIHHHVAGADYWEIRSKDGRTTFHGTPDSAGDDPAAIADPSDRTKVFAWLMSATRDLFGNRVVYDYRRDLGEDGGHHWDQLYLNEIRYADFIAVGETRFLASVTFHYEDRPDPFSTYRAGFEVRTRRRCTRIEVHTHARERQLVRVYHLIYLDQRPGIGALPPNGASLLSQIRVTGHDGVASEELAPLEFSYTVFAPQGRRFLPITGADLPPRSLAHPDFELADLFGHGLPDVLQMNGVVRYWRNRGNGEYDLPREMREVPAGLQLADAGVQMIDANGDGRVDLMVTAAPLAGFFPLDREGGWDQRSFRPYRVAPAFSLEDPEVRLIDLDGDGVTDAARAGSRFELFFNSAATGWDEVRSVRRGSLDEFPDVQFSDPRVRFADMTGDSLQDIVLVFDGNVEYWPSLGHGRWGKRLHMRNSPRFPVTYDPGRILLGDVDGDGLADLVYVDDEQIHLHINQGGTSWSDPIVIDGTPPVTDMDAVRLADMLGTGVPGILWSTDAGSARDTLLFLDLIGSIKPYLLAEMNNHRGAVTRVTYESSTRFYAQDQQRHATRWKTSLPFPVQVVSRVEIVDDISQGKRTIEYSYHHGHFDGTEREFRGFGRVEQRDTQTFEEFHTAARAGEDARFASVAPEHFSPTLLTKSWFHQGPIGDELGAWEELDLSGEYWPGDSPKLPRPPELTQFLLDLPRRVRRDAIRTLRGAELRTEAYALDGTSRADRPYTVAETLLGVRHEFGSNLGTTLSDVEGFFPHQIAKRTTQWERGDDPMTHFEFMGGYDAVGQCREHASIACPRGWRNLVDVVPETTPFIATFTRTDFANTPDDALYIKDRVARTTTFELRHEGDKTLNMVRADAATVGDERIISQALTYYDGDAFEGLPFLDVGPFGTAVRTETLAFTEQILEQVHGAQLPPYLVPGSPPEWTGEYPQRFRDVQTLAGFVFHDGSGPQTRGFFVSESVRFDFHTGSAGRGLPLTKRGPMGQETHITYDEFALLPIAATDTLGLERRAEYDYRAMQPRQVVDTNGNRTQFGFSPLGFLISVTAMGKEGEAVGDTPQQPGTRMEYDFLAFANSPPGARRPIFVKTVQRDYHATDTDVPAEVKDNTFVRVEFSDGFGRVIQVRTLAQDVSFGTEAFGGEVIPLDQNMTPGPSRGRVFADPASPPVVVSGLQVFDNKGQVVEQYEPFFATGFEYSPPGGQEQAGKAVMFYDPRGQLVRTINPDGSVKRVVFGVPVQLNTPDDFTPTPWEAYTYDPNDAAGEFPGPHHVDPSHVNTPGSIEIDALGRLVRSTTRRGAGEGDLTVQTTYDALGNPIRITDTAGRTAFSYVYDLLSSDQQRGRVLRDDSIDRGTRRIVFDAAGREVERRDTKGALVLQAYDVANRPTHLWARDDSNRPMTLRQQLTYGDSAGLPQPASHNLIGRLHRHLDEAGVMEISDYDFKGNILRQHRRVLSDTELLSQTGTPGFTPYEVDWERPDQQNALDPRIYQTDTTFDALNRVKQIVFPEDVSLDRKVLVPAYGRNGALQGLSVRHQGGSTDQPFVVHIAYNARGQRTLIAHGNGVMTRYAYDAGTFQIGRLRSERFVQEGPFDFVPSGGVLQDLGYERDLVGNVTRMRDRSPGSGVPNTVLGSDALDREFGYDALYRMISSSGREHVVRNPSADPWLDEMFPTPSDATQTRSYARSYRYDDSDALIECVHVTPDSTGNFTRTFVIDPSSNRVVNTVQASTSVPHLYDACGNMTREGSSRHLHWNHGDRLLAFRTQAGAGVPSLEAVYAYDATGHRVRKVVRHQNGSVSSVTYIGNSFEHHRDSGQENNSVHVWDVVTRLATLRVGAPLPNDGGPAIQYLLQDHIQNTSVVVDDSGSFVRREEFYPYGGTSFGGFARKRYRFTGKERDEESGLSHHGVRYYAPSLARWISPDPAGPLDGLNLYRYGQNNPIRFFDHSGKQSQEEGSWIGSTAYHPWQIWLEPMRPAGDNWFVRASKWVYGKVKTGVQFQWSLSKQPYSKTMDAMGLMVGKTKQAASSIWNWAKDHKLLAAGIGLGVALVGLFFRKSLWNWVIAPAIRIASNTAFGYAIGGKTGAVIGFVMGTVHGFAMAKAGSYDWKSGWGWLAFAADNTWSLFNSFIASGFATLNVGWNEIDDSQSKDSNALYFKSGWIPDKDTTLGNVIVGNTVPKHESVHVWQARVLGPIYVPAVAAFYEIATVLPYWLLYGDCSVTGVGSYFMQGVYPNTLHELMAYAFEGNPC